jgi:GTP:adenosylcobinamide-phosphate guanylyltransferase
VKVDAVVLAGGDGAVIDPTSRFKGLLPIAGRPMVEWIVDALREAETVHEVAVVVPTAENLGSWADKVDKLVVSDGSFAENVIAGVRAFRVDRPLLIATGDIPALIPEAIDDYVNRSLASGAEVTYPLVREADMLEQFPGSKRTFVKIAGGPVTGGNVMLITPEVAERNTEIGQRLFDTRKSALKMARVLSFGFVLRLVTGRLRTQDVEERMNRLLGAKCAAIYTSHASIGADVDKPVDVVVAERVLSARESGRNSSSDVT